MTDRVIQWDTCNTKKLIEEVKKRPTLWDHTYPNYYVKDLKKLSWDEINHIFHKSTPKATEKIINKLVMKRWHYLRRKLSDSLRKKSYFMFCEDLSFLLKVMISRNIGDSEISEIRDKNERISPIIFNESNSDDRELIIECKEEPGNTKEQSPKIKIEDIECNEELIDPLYKTIKKEEQRLEEHEDFYPKTECEDIEFNEELINYCCGTIKEEEAEHQDLEIEEQQPRRSGRKRKTPKLLDYEYDDP